MAISGLWIESRGPVFARLPEIGRETDKGRLEICERSSASERALKRVCHVPKLICHSIQFIAWQNYYLFACKNNTLKYIFIVFVFSQSALFYLFFVLGLINPKIKNHCDLAVFNLLNHFLDLDNI